MASLYKRANAQQKRILRIIEGAVKNTADHHPDFDYSPQLARSIAKRAAGTLTAAMPDVLAGEQPSPSDRSVSVTRASDSGRPTSQPSDGAGTARVICKPRARKGDAAQDTKPHPHLRKIIKLLSKQVGEAKLGGQCLFAEGLIEALRVISRVQNGKS